jgi:hypothetical protein
MQHDSDAEPSPTLGEILERSPENIAHSIQVLYHFLAYELPDPPEQYKDAIAAKRSRETESERSQRLEGEARATELRALRWVGYEQRRMGEEAFARRWISAEVLAADSDEMRANRRARYGDMSDLEATQFFLLLSGWVSSCNILGEHLLEDCDQNIAKISEEAMNWFWRARQMADELSMDYDRYIKLAVECKLRARLKPPFALSDLCSVEVTEQMLQLR